MDLRLGFAVIAQLQARVANQAVQQSIVGKALVEVPGKLERGRVLVPAQQDHHSRFVSLEIVRLHPKRIFHRAIGLLVEIRIGGFAPAANQRLRQVVITLRLRGIFLDLYLRCADGLLGGRQRRNLSGHGRNRRCEQGRHREGFHGDQKRWPRAPARGHRGLLDG